MRFDRLSLVLLNLLAIARVLLPAEPSFVEAIAVLFLVRVTMAMKDNALVNEGRHPALAVSNLPARTR